MTRKPKPRALVVIEWHDSCSLRGGVWNDQDSVSQMTPDECRSVGWVLREDKSAVVLVGHLSASQCSGDICIPKSAIKHRWEVRQQRRKR